MVAAAREDTRREALREPFSACDRRCGQRYFRVVTNGPRVIDDPPVSTRRPHPWLAAIAVVLAAVVACTSTSPVPSASTASTRPLTSPTALASASPSASPSPTPQPTATRFFEDLSGVDTSAELAHRHPVAVMLDDSPAARPQAGLADASLVWQAPVEGGIPRYMAIYQSRLPNSIGPVRSARLYFVRWAAEWQALYLHAGGPPPLRAFLRGSQQLVVNVDGKRTARVSWRRAPHNLYADGPKLRRYGMTIGAADDSLGYDPSAPGRLQPFRDGASLGDRGRDGGTLRISYRAERVDYAYDRASNTWLRSVDGRPHHDAGSDPNAGRGTPGEGPRIAPTAVIVLLVPIRRSERIDGPALGRLEADSIGSNRAWVFADGHVIEGMWVKQDEESRTRFLDAGGAEIVLPRGQIFFQVVPKRSALIHDVEPAE